MQPIYIAQYFPFGGRDDCRDPRQHSLGMTYLVQLEGSIEPQGEALDFNWFSIARLPNEDEFGFNQDIVIKECIKIFAKR
jgi:ADP-ribose pyrophosphatase YjhB (NUDIX family)